MPKRETIRTSGISIPGPGQPDDRLEHPVAIGSRLGPQQFPQRGIHDVPGCYSTVTEKGTLTLPTVAVTFAVPGFTPAW